MQSFKHPFTLKAEQLLITVATSTVWVYVIKSMKRYCTIFITVFEWCMASQRCVKVACLYIPDMFIDPFVEGP